MNVITTEEMARKCNVSPRWIRKLASEGRIYPARKVHRTWLFTPSSTVIRPPERWKRKPTKMVLPHEELSIRDTIKHAEYWLN